jgi:hypothetical protein
MTVRLRVQVVCLPSSRVLERDAAPPYVGCVALRHTRGEVASPGSPWILGAAEPAS